jgi:hypothetical protein
MFLHLCIKVTTSSKGLILQKNDKPPLVYTFVTLCIHKTLYQIIISPLYLIENIVVYPVRCMNLLLGTVKSNWGRLCVQVDLPNLPITWMVYGENCPLPPHLTPMVGIRKPGPVPLFSSTLNRCSTDLWQSDWFSPIVTINFNISLFHLPMRKSKLTLILGCHSACFL